MVSAEELLGRPYKGIPFRKSEFEVISDSSSLPQSYVNFELANQGTCQVVIDLKDEGTELCFIYDLASNTPGTPYTGSETVVPRGSFLTLVDHVEAQFVGGGFQINEPQGTAPYLLNWKLAIEENTEYALNMNPSLCYALDTSPSLTGSFVPGSTAAASYAGIGSSQTVNAGIALRNAMVQQKQFFNAATASWRGEAHIPLRHLHPIFRQGTRYGLPIQNLKIWLNYGQTVMPFTVQGGPAPKITFLGQGQSTFRYRKLTPTPEFQKTLEEHLAGKTETIRYMRAQSLPGLSGIVSPTLQNINLGSVADCERLWVFIYPTGAQLSATNLAPFMLNTGLSQVMIKAGGFQLYDRQLALPNALGQYQYSELFRVLQESMPADSWANRPAGQFGQYFWSIANRVYCFPIHEEQRLNAGQSLMFAGVITQDVQAGAQGLPPSNSNPTDVYFVAECTERVRVTYKKLMGNLTPVYERIE